MKIEILQENFNLALNLVSRILANKPQLAILSHVLLEASDGKLVLTTSNQELTIITEIGAKVSFVGKFTVPGRTLLEIVSSLSAEKITLTQEGTTMGIKAGGFTATINGTPAQEYPTLIPSTAPKGASITIPSSQFQDLITKTVFSAATDEGRTVLTGVLFKSDDGNLVLAATDGFRLSVNRQEKIAKDLKTNLVIPAKTLLEIVRILSEDKIEKIAINLLEETNQVFFDLGSIRIYSSLITGTFPDYEKIIPANQSLKLSLEASELQKAVRLASIFARESSNIIKFHITHSKLLISANAPQVGENESEVEVKIDGDLKDDFSVAFNFHYLLDFLSAIGGSGEMTIELTSSTTPGVFKAVSDPNFLHIIMPVRVQG